MKLVSWNVNGIRAAFKKGLPEAVARLQPDIICLQEIKASDSDLDQIMATLHEYEFSMSCAEKKGYSGVATLIRKKLRHQPIAEIDSFNLSQSNGDLPIYESEGRILGHIFDNYILLNLYFPSGTSGESRQEIKYHFLDAVTRFLGEQADTFRNRLIICGDFNICHKPIDIHHPDEATRRQLTGFLPEERAWMDKFVDLGFVDSFRTIHPEKAHQYSWWTYRANAREKNLGWRIDYFFVAQALMPKIKSAAIYQDIRGSDHCPIELELDL